jgi:mono/diheme cytochrome c family protein
MAQDSDASLDEGAVVQFLSGECASDTAEVFSANIVAGELASLTSAEVQDDNIILGINFESEELSEIAEDAKVAFLSGACEGEQTTVIGWDESSGALTVIGPLANSPAAGDLIVIENEGSAKYGVLHLQEVLDGKPAEGDQIVVEGGSILRHGRGLYMRHCSHCHGTSGDGNGPTAQYLNPKPRDYRHGVFKFTSTTDSSKASRDDLLRVLKYGIPGTYMPSFLLLEDDELHAIVEYVRFLSMRGEFERSLVTELKLDYSTKAVADQMAGGDMSRQDVLEQLQEYLEVDFPDAVSFVSDDLAEKWAIADTEEALIVPEIPRVPDTPESRRRGRELYLGKTYNCADCHGAYGQGNGPQTIAYEKNPATGEPYDEPGLHDVWDNLNQPRNLTQGIYRGGRRPIDLFRRIHAGIKGSRMPSFKNTPQEDIWHVVNYVLSLPFDPDPGATGTAATDAAGESAETAAD